MSPPLYPVLLVLVKGYERLVHRQYLREFWDTSKGLQQQPRIVGHGYYVPGQKGHLLIRPCAMTFALVRVTRREALSEELATIT